MKIPNLVYDILKLISQAILPAIITALVTISQTVYFDEPASGTFLTVIAVLAAIDTALGTILMYLSDNYFKEDKKDEVK